MKPLAAALALFASVVLTDAHWIVMQSISWVEMSWNASQTEGQSLADVFSGKLICDHCCAIEEGKDSEGQRTIDLLSQGRILAPVAFERLSLPERNWEEVQWPPRKGELSAQFISGVIVPPPWS